MRKIGKMNEMAWLAGVLLCSLGVSLCTKAGFGLSMIAAPAYIIHYKMVNYFLWYSQGTSEYVFQGIMLVIMCIAIKKFKLRYLLSFATALVSGFAIDGWLYLLSGNGVYEAMPMRIAAFALGELLTGLAVAFYFRTDMPLQIYELFVKEIAEKFGFPTTKVKLINDICMLAFSVCLTIVLNHSLVGIGIGTVIITVVNAPLISMFGRLLDKVFVFSPAFPKFMRGLGKQE